MDDLLNRINSEDSLSEYLLSTPLSAVGNRDYNGALTHDIFQEHFLVFKNNNNMTRTQNEIEEILENEHKNTLFISGFKRSGKTTFIYYALKFINEKRRDNNFQVITCDFEKLYKGKKKQPFRKIFYNKIISFIIDDYTNRQCKIIKKAYEVYSTSAESDEFDPIEDINEVTNFFDELFNISTNRTELKTGELKKASYDLLEELDTTQLLCVFTFLHACKKIYCENESDFKLVILFDNIDDSKDMNYTYEEVSEFITSYKEFLECGSNFFRQLKYENKVKINLNENFNFIFCVRDTTTAKFSHHFIDRSINITHYDISDFVDKSKFAKRKLQFLEKNNIQTNIDRKIIKLVGDIIKSNYFNSNFFPLYNNDYNTAVRELEELIKMNHDDINKNSDIFNSDGKQESYKSYGMHAYILRFLLQNFIKTKYLKNIRAYDEDECSYTRLLLNYLNNIQKSHSKHFLDKDRDHSITLKKLYKEVASKLNITNISKVMSHMYILHRRENWNHLINIDAPYEIEAGNIEDKFNKYAKGGEFLISDGKIRITCSGRTFVRTVATHFEYFSIRYAPKEYALFDIRNLNKNTEEDFDCIKLIDKVYKYTEACCSKVYKFDIEKLYGSKDLSVAPVDFHDRCKKYLVNYPVENKNQTHVERVLNNHILYIDAYRIYVINSHIDIPEKHELCRIILEKIQMYIDLIKTYDEKNYISDYGIRIMNKFIENINEIGDNYFNPKPISFGVKIT